MSDVYVGTDEKIHVVKGGADTVLNFNNVKFESYGTISLSGAVNGAPKTVSKTLKANGKIIAVTMNVRGSYNGSTSSNYGVSATIQNNGKSVQFKLETDGGTAYANVNGTLVYI